MTITYSECVCSLSYPACKANLLYSTVIYGLSCSTIFFHIRQQTAQFSGGGIIKHKMCFDVSTTSIWNISHFKKNSARCYHKCTCKVSVTLVRFQWILNFLNAFSKNTQISNFTKIRPVGDELFRVDGQTYMTNLIVAFRNFANAL